MVTSLKTLKAEVGNLGAFAVAVTGIPEIGDNGRVNWNFNLKTFRDNHFGPAWDKYREKGRLVFSRPSVAPFVTGKVWLSFFKKVGLWDSFELEFKALQGREISKNDLSLFKGQSDEIRDFFTLLLGFEPEVTAYFGEGKYSGAALVNLEWKSQGSVIAVRGHEFGEFVIKLDVRPADRYFGSGQIGSGNFGEIEAGTKKGIDMGVLSTAKSNKIIIPITEDSTDLIKGPIVGRDDIVEKVQRSLLRLSRPNVVMVGPKGIGVKAVLGAVARSITKGTGIKELDRFNPVYLDVAQAVNVHKTGDDTNRFLDSLLEELSQDKNTLLVNDYAEHLMFGSFTFPKGVKIFGDVFHDLVSNGKLTFLGGMSAEYYHRNLPILGEEWSSVLDFIQLAELSPEDTFHALKETLPEKEKLYGVSISEEAIRACIYLSHKYLANSVLPAKAIYLLDESIARLKIKNPSKGFKLNPFAKPGLVLTEPVITETISDLTGMPLGRLSVNDLKALRDFESNMAERIIGQEEAVKAVAQTIRAVRAGFGDNKRPDGVFYFLGPSGVGKTELALVLSEVLFGSQNKLMRIDMSEFVHPADVTRLIGAPPGYVGYDKGGVLTEWAKKNPISVILLDEFEKAHPGCWDVFLQLFDAGRLTDGQGNTVDFANTIIVMTSNIGSELFVENIKSNPVGFSTNSDDIHGPEFEKISEEIHRQLKGIFRPEFLNRLDEVVIFRPLVPPALMKIAALMLKKSSIQFQVSEEILKFLAIAGYEPQYGARHLKRAIQNMITEPVANLIIEGKLNQGDPVKISLQEGKLRFEKATGVGHTKAGTHGY